MAGVLVLFDIFVNKIGFVINFLKFRYEFRYQKITVQCCVLVLLRRAVAKSSCKNSIFINQLHFLYSIKLLFNQVRVINRIFTWLWSSFWNLSSYGGNIYNWLCGGVSLQNLPRRPSVRPPILHYSKAAKKCIILFLLCTRQPTNQEDTNES